MELEDNLPLLEWLANNYKNFGAGLEIITDRLVIIHFLWMGEVPALRSRESWSRYILLEPGAVIFIKKRLRHAGGTEGSHHF